MTKADKPPQPPAPEDCEPAALGDRSHGHPFAGSADDESGSCGRAFALDRGHPDYWIVKIHRTGVPVGDVEWTDALHGALLARIHALVPPSDPWGQAIHVADVIHAADVSGENGRRTVPLDSQREWPADRPRQENASED